MPDDEEWAFEAETDLWDDGETPAQSPEGEPEPSGPTGRDGDSVVTVIVSPDGEVRQVRLTEDWKSKVDPRGLHSGVLTAANAATVEALAQRAREVQENPPSPVRGNADETPLTAQDVLLLDDAVRRELEQFSTRISSVGLGVVSAESSGGQVSGSAQGGRYLSLDLDATCGRSRDRRHHHRDRGTAGRDRNRAELHSGQGRRSRRPMGTDEHHDHVAPRRLAGQQLIMTHFPMDPRTYVWLPPRLATKIRRTLPLLGGVTTLVALAMCVAVPVLGYSLPTSHSATNGISVMFGMFSAVLLLMSGIALVFAPAWVEVGHHPGGAMSVGPLCGGSVSVVVLPLFFFFYSGGLTWSEPQADGDIQITFGIFVFMMMPLIAVALGVVDAVVGWPLLRPSPRTIQRYAR
ncbi:YbaB/EbfC family nucleoid-associated protein [Amycolatopsis sp. NPDC048633]|uniref:YbaB/EbfC family nucleoid-associated protein n=1 Tax=Amycolatopsis sp. NPDC048633 TaxID=3157095 RepID=UPI0033ED28FC